LSDWKRKVTAEYVPTDAQRSLVESASAFGITQAEIAAQLKISEPTLRKHFREESIGTYSAVTFRFQAPNQGTRAR
jgi:AraC-like DNA-binding protein